MSFGSEGKDNCSTQHIQVENDIKTNEETEKVIVINDRTIKGEK